MLVVTGVGRPHDLGILFPALTCFPRVCHLLVFNIFPFDRGYRCWRFVWWVEMKLEDFRVHVVMLVSLYAGIYCGIPG